MSRGKVLELLRPDDNGKMQTICSTEVFGTIRAIMPFRLTDVGRTYIVMGTDSGRIVILEYSKVCRYKPHTWDIDGDFAESLDRHSSVYISRSNYGKARRFVHGHFLYGIA